MQLHQQSSIGKKKEVIFLRDEAGKNYVTDSGPELLLRWFSQEPEQDEKILLMIQTALKFMLSVQTHYAQQGETEGVCSGIVHCTPSPKLQAVKFSRLAALNHNGLFRNTASLKRRKACWEKRQVALLQLLNLPGTFHLANTYSAQVC